MRLFFCRMVNCMVRYVSGRIIMKNASTVQKFSPDRAKKQGNGNFIALQWGFFPLFWFNWSLVSLFVATMSRLLLWFGWRSIPLLMLLFFFGCNLQFTVNHLLSNQNAFSSYPKKLILKICSSQNNISHYNHHRPLSFDFLNLIQRSSVLFLFVCLCKFRNINRTL